MQFQQSESPKARRRATAKVRTPCGQAKRREHASRGCSGGGSGYSAYYDTPVKTDLWGELIQPLFWMFLRGEARAKARKQCRDIVVACLTMLAINIGIIAVILAVGMTVAHCAGRRS